MNDTEYRDFTKKARTLLSSLSARRTRNLFFGIYGDKWVYTNSLILELGFVREGSCVMHVVNVFDKDFCREFRKFFRIKDDEVTQIDSPVLAKALNNANGIEHIQVKRKKNELFIHFPAKKMKKVDTADEVEFTTAKYGHIHEYYGEKEAILDHIREYSDGALKSECREAHGEFAVRMENFSKGPMTSFRFPIGEIRRSDGESFFEKKYDVSTVFHDGLDVPSWKECWKKTKDSRASIHLFVPLNTFIVCFFTEYSNSLFECWSFRPLYGIFPLDKERVEVIYGKS